MVEQAVFSRFKYPLRLGALGYSSLTRASFVAFVAPLAGKAASGLNRIFRARGEIIPRSSAGGPGA